VKTRAEARNNKGLRKEGENDEKTRKHKGEEKDGKTRIRK
jgi:hypothetical protein